MTDILVIQSYLLPFICSKLKNIYFDFSVRQYLRNLLSTMAQREGLTDVNFLTKDIHMLPDFHGNRSPLADPTLRGMISGLCIDHSNENLALLYLATLQALSVNSKYILYH